MTSKVMLYVFTYDDTTWKVADGRITTVPQDASGMDGASARIASGQAEQCRMVLAMQVGGSEKYTVGPETKVILPTEHDDKYVPPNLPKDARPVAIACTRFGIVPAPNDYKLATAGLHLMIKDIGDGHTLRLAQLDRDTGKFEFKLLQGDPLPADLAARVDARLRAFDKATQTGQ
jgi:hypothetical protein